MCSAETNINSPPECESKCEAKRNYLGLGPMYTEDENYSPEAGVARKLRIRSS